MMGVLTGTLYQSCGGWRRCRVVSSMRREATVDWERHAKYEAGGGAA